MENNTKAGRAIDVRLRALEPSDIDKVYRWENDPSIWKISNTHTPYSKHILEKFIEAAHLDIYQTRQMRFMIDVFNGRSSKGRAVGTIDMFDFDPYHNRAGVGILIGEKTDRKKGYASAALTKFIDYSFGMLQLHQLYCNILSSNKVSLKLFQQHGFRICGKKKDWIRMPGSYAEEQMLQLINPADSTFIDNSRKAHL
jgi:diamine N-acetyltransferase